MSYTALYRKFRPAEFEDVKGQEHIVTTLQNQIKANRIGACVFILWDAWDRKDNGCKNICKSCEL